jgi:hypothetical protein
MTNTHRTIDTLNDIDAMMPRRCPNFLRTLHDTITSYFAEGDPANPLTDADRLWIAEAIIDRRI